MSRPVRISLVICTFNREDILPRCLHAALNQSLPSADYEVLVVDNASTDNTRAVVERHREVRYLHFAERGLSLARNAGARAARAPIIAYIDDDAIADSHLLEQLLTTYAEHPGAGSVGGRIDIQLPPELPKWYSKDFAGYYSAFQLSYTETTRITEMWEFPFGANVSFQRQALDDVGYFNVKLGRVGKGTAGGEELDAICRIAQRCYEVYYNPAACVDHVIMPDRMKWSHIASSARAAGRNWAYYENELLHRNQGIGGDLQWFFGAWSRVLLRRNAWLAYSQTIFYRAKILRKLRYLTSRH